MAKIYISGFADEIDNMLIPQLETVTKLGMQYISLRSADKKGIANFSVEEFEEEVLPKLKEYGVKVSSIGSPIGKVGIKDEEGFLKQKDQLEVMCQIANLLGTKYIRMFSFFMPAGEDPAIYRDEVIAKLREFLAIAKKYDVILMHENEKDIYGDVGSRCLDLLSTIDDPSFVAAFDFANYVQCGEDTMECWNMTRPWIKYIHIKDAITTDKENVLCGTGEGQIKQILDLAINKEGYEGFLTLEPHLVIFGNLKNLETEAAEKIIKFNKYETGADGYAAQYHALCEILKEIGVEDYA